MIGDNKEFPNVDFVSDSLTNFDVEGIIHQLTKRNCNITFFGWCWGKVEVERGRFENFFIDKGGLQKILNEVVINQTKENYEQQNKSSQSK